MGLGLYEIGTEYQALYDLAENVDYDHDGRVIDNTLELAEMFGEIELELKDKLVNTQYIIKELEVMEQGLKDEAKRLTEKAKVLQNRQKRLKELVKTVMIATGETKIKTDKFSFNVRTSETFNYDEVNTFALEDEFLKVKTELDKVAIKKYVKAGGTIEGLRVSEDTILTVR